MQARTMYRVKWKDARPFIEVGTSVVVGTRRPQRRLKFPSETRLLPLDQGSESLKGAIESAIMASVDLCVPPSLRFRRFALPWHLVTRVTRLYRLYHNLLRHHPGLPVRAGRPTQGVPQGQADRADGHARRERDPGRLEGYA